MSAGFNETCMSCLEWSDGGLLDNTYFNVGITLKWLVDNGLLVSFAEILPIFYSI